MSSVSGAEVELVLIVAAVFFIGIGAVIAFAMKGKGLRFGGGLAVFGVVLLAGGFLAPALLPASSSVAPGPAPPSATINVVENSSVSLPNGETWNAATSTFTVDLVYNSTSYYLAVNNVVAGTSGKHNYVVFPFNLIRTDAINATYSFAASLAQLETVVSLGSTPTAYSFLGYTAATGTSPATWQAFWNAGTEKNLKPSGAAPGTVSNVLTTGVPVKAFSTASVNLVMSLAGGNSTSAPTTWAEAIQNYTTYSYTLTFGQGVPGEVTIDWVLIGWHA